MDHLEEIRSRIGIEELVGSYVQLKKAGRNFKGLCPFHNEKTPSFIVSPEKGIAYCFGCQKGGDIFKFTQLMENIDFGETVKILAQKANVTLPASVPREHSKRLRTIEINQSVVKFFTEQLEKQKKHREYFLKRGLSEETIRRFKLGYAPNSFHKLKDHLLKNSYQEEELITAGVLNQRSMADKNTYDRFRNRLIFPIYDHQDNPVGFGGRIINEGEPKYLNSPETPAYNKSFLLYGLNWGKEAIKKADMAIFVEGYMDVITAHQAGTENVIATSGTALATQQLKLIKRYTKNIVFAFDQDSAGMEATRRAIELAQTTDLNIKIIIVPHGKDPDECIKDNPEDWQKAIQNPVTVMDFYFAYTNRHFDKNTLDGKKEIMNFLLPLIKQYKSEVEQGYHLERLSLELKTDIRLLWQDLKKVNKSTITKSPTAENNVSQKNIFSREEFLLGFIFCHPDLYSHVHKNLIDNIPYDSATEKFYNTCKKVYNRESNIDIMAVKCALPPEDQEKVDIYRLLIEENYPDFSESAAQSEVKKLIQSINRQNLYNIQKDYEFKIRTATDSQEKLLLLNQYNEILKLKNKI